MSTWQAQVRAPRECVVLLSGENQAQPTHLHHTGTTLLISVQRISAKWYSSPVHSPTLCLSLCPGLSSWDYYVTMPMPASTFTLAVGYWRQATAQLSTAQLTPPVQGTRAGASHTHAGRYDLFPVRTSLVPPPPSWFPSNPAIPGGRTRSSPAVLSPALKSSPQAEGLRVPPACWQLCHSSRNTTLSTSSSHGFPPTQPLTPGLLLLQGGPFILSERLEETWNTFGFCSSSTKMELL